MSNLNEVFGEIIHSYTRKQAIADGFLVEVDSKISREAGLVHNVALTRAVYEDCVHWTDKDSKRQTYQDESGRLWDVLSMCRFGLQAAIKRGLSNTGQGLLFQLYVVPRDEKSRAHKARKTILKVILGPGDEGEPVITILKPDED